MIPSFVSSVIAVGETGLRADQVLETVGIPSMRSDALTNHVKEFIQGVKEA